MSEDNVVYGSDRPLPCVRDEYGEIKGQTVKSLLAKIDEELNELKWELSLHPMSFTACESAAHYKPDGIKAIAEEAADTITAITTLLAAFGIDEEMRNEAQRRVNHKNFERRRL